LASFFSAGEVHPARERSEAVVGQLQDRLGVLRAGRDERVEIAARNLALELEQLGRALDRGHLLEVGAQRLVGALGLLDVTLAEILRAGGEDLAALDERLDVALGELGRLGQRLGALLIGYLGFALDLADRRR
jgi:hypothetical protein